MKAMHGGWCNVQLLGERTGKSHCAVIASARRKPEGGNAPADDPSIRYARPSSPVPTSTSLIPHHDGPACSPRCLPPRRRSSDMPRARALQHSPSALASSWLRPSKSLDKSPSCSPHDYLPKATKNAKRGAVGVDAPSLPTRCACVWRGVC